MARIDNCDKVVGNGETIIAVGSYKSGEDTRYKYGIKLNIPAKADMGAELEEKIYNLGLHRAMSVKAAGMFNKSNDFGSDEDAQAYAAMFSTVDGWKEAFEKVRREGAGEKADSQETKIIKYLSDMLRVGLEGGQIASAKVPVPRADDPPKTAKGTINFNAWAKILRTEKHPWADKAEKRITAIANSVAKDLD